LRTYQLKKTGFKTCLSNATLRRYSTFVPGTSKQPTTGKRGSLAKSKRYKLLVQIYVVCAVLAFMALWVVYEVGLLYTLNPVVAPCLVPGLFNVLFGVRTRAFSLKITS
jgi:hypothetical protein